MRTVLAAFLAVTLVTPSAHALTDEEIAIAHSFEGAWGMHQAPKDYEVTDMGCAEARALTIRIEADEQQLWRFYFHPEQRFSGTVITGASDDGGVQRLTVESFAPIGTHTDVYERDGDRVTLRYGSRNLVLKRC